MSAKINGDQREAAIEAIRSEGTMKAGASASGVSVRTLNMEMKRSAIFKRRILEAREEGKRNMSDNALQLVKDYVDGKYDKTDRNRLTAALALLNWAEPGFRGSTQVQGRIEHDVRVITAVPRPKYDELPAPKITIDNPPKKMLKSSKREIRDEKGSLLAVQTVAESLVEEAIEGEVINE